MKTNNQVIGKSTEPLNMTQVRRESEILEEILKPDLHEFIMQKVCEFNQPPFRILNDYVLKGITPELFAHYKANVAMLDKETLAAHPGTDRLIEDIWRWNPAEGIQ